MPTAARLHDGTDGGGASRRAVQLGLVALLVAVICGGTVPIAVAAPPIRAAVRTARSGAAAPPEVHVAYYPWYGTPETDGSYLHWTHGVTDGSTAQAPDDIGANFWPAAGLYSSNDPATVDRHMSEIAGAAIDVVVVSWWGPGSFEDRSVPRILDAAAARGLRVTFLLEPSYGSVDEARSWIVYLIDTYGDHPAFYRSAFHDDLPMLYTFSPFKRDPQGTATIGPEQWASILTPGGVNTIRGTEHDAAVIGHVELSAFVDLVAGAGFDGVNNYFAGPKANVLELGPITLSGDIATWPGLVARAERAGVPFHPSVGPGYIDERIRPNNTVATTDRRNGAYYESMVDAACRTSPDIISITSYNEWHEGTQIEPTAEHVTSVTSYPGFEGGPGQYLDLTREWVTAFKAGTLCDVPVEPTTSTTTTTPSTNPTSPTPAAPPATPVVGSANLTG